MRQVQRRGIQMARVETNDDDNYDGDYDGDYDDDDDGKMMMVMMM